MEFDCLVELMHEEFSLEDLFVAFFGLFYIDRSYLHALF